MRSENTGIGQATRGRVVMKAAENLGGAAAEICKVKLMFVRCFKIKDILFQKYVINSSGTLLGVLDESAPISTFVYCSKKMFTPLSLSTHLVISY